MTTEEYRNDANRLNREMATPENDRKRSAEADAKDSLEVWKAGMEAGDRQAAMRYCAHLIAGGKASQHTVDILEALVRDEDEPCADACALLYHYYSRTGDDDLAAEWLDCGLDMGSEMCEDIAAEERDDDMD